MLGRGNNLLRRTVSVRLIGVLVLPVLMAGGAWAPSASAAEPPLASTEESGEVAGQGATMNGRVDPNGAAVPVCRFEYGTTTAYGALAPCSPASLGTGDFNVAVSAQAEALEPGTTYHYRLVASGAGGATQGIDRTFTTTGSPACPNAAIRLEQGIAAIQLPDCMGLERVSPPKFNQVANTPMISADGERVSFWSLGALAGTPGNLSPFGGDVYVAEREENGWSTRPTSPPYPLTRTWSGTGSGARSFTPDLSHWVVLAATEEASEYWRGIGQFFRGGFGGSFDPISPLLTPFDGAIHQAENVTNGELKGASADLDRLFVATGEASATYLPGDPVPTGPGSGKNVYVAQVGFGGQPTVKLGSRDEVGSDAGKTWGGNCGVLLGGIVDPVGGVWRDQGAVSLDGSRAFFSARAAQPDTGPCSELNKLRLLERTEAPGGGTADLTELIDNECTRVSPACKTEAEADGDDFFQGASVDGTKVYFTTNRQLTDSDLDGSAAECSKASGVPGCDLYLYDSSKPAGGRLTQVSAGESVVGKHVVGEEASVFKGTVAISGDGSRVYFAAVGVLTAAANPAGKAAAEYPAGDPKLYVWSAATGVIQFVGALSPGDVGLFGDNGTLYNTAYPVPVTGQELAGEEVGGDGHVLLFQTTSSLTAVDIDGARSDAYRYDSSGDPPTLECVSCRPGGPDSEPFDLGIGSTTAAKANIAGTAFAEEGRWVSEDGESVLVRTAEPLVSGDLNGAVNDYLWRSGTFSLLPGTAGLNASFFVSHPVLSQDGSQVAFAARPALLKSDGDTAEDVYVARVGGGFPDPTGPTVCLAESCQGPLASAPAAPIVATATYSGRGNVKDETQPRRCAKGKRRVTRDGRTRCVKKKAAKPRSTAKRADNNRGGKK
jgi:hypothetical protein